MPAPTNLAARRIRPGEPKCDGRSRQATVSRKTRSVRPFPTCRADSGTLPRRCRTSPRLRNRRKPKVQAPKQRATPRTPDEQRAWRTVIIIGALGFLGLAVALGFLFFGRGGDEALASAGCTVQTFPGQGQDHVRDAPGRLRVQLEPADDGPAQPGAGAVRLLRGAGRPAPPRPQPGARRRRPPLRRRRAGRPSVEAMREWWRDDPNGIVVSPLPSLGSGIAMTAWNADIAGGGQTASDQRGVLAKCPRLRRRRGERVRRRVRLPGPRALRARSSSRPATRSDESMPGEGVEPSRPESRPSLSRVRLTSSATPARPRS